MDILRVSSSAQTEVISMMMPSVVTYPANVIKMCQEMAFIYKVLVLVKYVCLVCVIERKINYKQEKAVLGNTILNAFQSSTI